MKNTICPQCGTLNTPHARFCRNCGFDLFKYRKQLAHQNISSQKELQTYQSMTHSNSHKRHNHSLLKFLIVIIILFFIFISFAYAYSNNEFSSFTNDVSNQNRSHTYQSNNSKTSTTNSNTSSSQTSYSIIKEFWNNVNTKVGGKYNNSNSNITQFFQNGMNNSYYHSIEQWIHFVTKANASNNTRVIDIHPYDFSSDGLGNIYYKVYYNFEKNFGTHRIQIYNWHTKIQDNKIVNMGSPREPAKDYTQNN